MERDDEIKGQGNSYTTLFRQYDARLGRWLSIDPKASLMPWQSPYNGMDDNPIIKNDKNGDCSICDQLEKYGERNIEKDLLKTLDDVTTPSDVSYSPSGIAKFMAEGFGQLSQVDIKTVSETVTTSTIKFSETKDEAVITKTTVTTVVKLVGENVTTVSQTTVVESQTLGVDNDVSSAKLDYEIPFVNSVITQTNTTNLKLDEISSGLSKKLDEAVKHNSNTTKANSSKLEKAMQKANYEDNNSQLEPKKVESFKKKKR